MILILALTFFVNLICWHIISLTLIKEAIKHNPSSANELKCSGCGVIAINKSFKNGVTKKSPIRPLNIFGVNSNYCRKCYKKYHYISLLTIVLFPLTFAITAKTYNINISSLKCCYYMVPTSVFYLEWITGPLFFVSFLFVILYHLYQHVKFNKKPKSQESKMMKKRTILTLVLIGVIVLIPLVYQRFYADDYYYYIIEYDIEVPNEEELIDTVESFDFGSLFHPYLKGGTVFGYIERDDVQELKRLIDENTAKEWAIGTSFYFEYYFIAEQHSEIYLTYNNRSIIEISDEDRNEIISNPEGVYINFTQIPYASNASSECILSDVILIKQTLISGYKIPREEKYYTRQYIVADGNFEFLLIALPYLSEGITMMLCSFPITSEALNIYLK